MAVDMEEELAVVIWRAQIAAGGRKISQAGRCDGADQALEVAEREDARFHRWHGLEISGGVRQADGSS
jgi:hypothetical protein